MFGTGGGGERRCPRKSWNGQLNPVQKGILEPFFDGQKTGSGERGEGGKGVECNP